MKYLKKYESILKPYNIDFRLEKIRDEISNNLLNEVIEGDLTIDYPLYLELDSSIKLIRGDVRIFTNEIPQWMAEVEVEGDFWCQMNGMTSLKGAPRKVGGRFDCSINDLVSLEGAPEYVGGHFSSSINKLVNLVGAPKYVGENFYCYANPGKFTESEVKMVTDVRGKIFV